MKEQEYRRQEIGDRIQETGDGGHTIGGVALCVYAGVEGGRGWREQERERSPTTLP